MAETHVMSALIAKRTELANQIERAQEGLRQLICDLDSVDATMRVFDPAVDAPYLAVRDRLVPPQAAAFRGQLMRTVLTALRQSPGPLSTEDIARAVMEQRGLDVNDKTLLMTMIRRVGSSVRAYRDKGLVRSHPKQKGRHGEWELVREGQHSVLVPMLKGPA